MAYVDFFDEEVKARHGDWGKVLEEYLYSGPNPLINGYTGGRESTSFYPLVNILSRSEAKCVK